MSCPEKPWPAVDAPADAKSSGNTSNEESSASPSALPNDLPASLHALALAIAGQNQHLRQLLTTVLELVEQNGDLLQAMLPEDGEKPGGESAELNGSGRGKIHRRAPQQ